VFQRRDEVNISKLVHLVYYEKLEIETKQIRRMHRYLS